MEVAGQVARLSRPSNYKGAYAAIMEDEEAELAGHPRHGFRKRELCFLGCGICGCCLLLWFILSFFLINFWLAMLLSDYGTQVMGAETQVQRAYCISWWGWSQLDDVTIENPPHSGIAGRFADMKMISFDIEPLTLMQDVVHLEHVRIHDLTIHVTKPLHAKHSNADMIVKHLSKYLETDHPEEVLDILLNKKMLVNEISLFNIHAIIDMPLATNAEPPSSFRIKEIRVGDVGVEQNGIFLYQLIIVVLQRVLAGLLKKVPGQVMHQATTNSLTTVLNLINNDDWFDSVQEDVGNGLEDISLRVDQATEKLGDSIETAGEQFAVGMHHTAVMFGAKEEGALKAHRGVHDAAAKFSGAIRNVLHNVSNGVKKLEGGVMDMIQHTQKNLHEFTEDFKEHKKQKEDNAG